MGGLEDLAIKSVILHLVPEVAFAILHDDVEFIILDHIAIVVNNVVVGEGFELLDFVLLLVRERINLYLFDRPELAVPEFLSGHNNLAECASGDFPHLLVLLPHPQSVDGRNYHLCVRDHLLFIYIKFKLVCTLPQHKHQLSQIPLT